MAFTGYALALAFIVVEALAVPVEEGLEIACLQWCVQVYKMVDVLLRPALDILVLRHVGSSSLPGV